MNSENAAMIIKKIREGDTQQVALLYKMYRSEFIAWLCKTYRCEIHEARDIYQTAFGQLLENITSGKLKELTSNMKTYLFGIGKNKFFEYRRANYRYEFGLDQYDIPDEVQQVETEEREARLVLVEQCLEKLGDPCKSLLELYYFHDLSMDQIAEKLSYKNRDTAKNLKYKCLRRLRKIFSEEMDKTLEHSNVRPQDS